MFGVIGGFSPLLDAAIFRPIPAFADNSPELRRERPA
jgi:hypothetical protein